MLVPETIEMFALLELEPPSTINGVSDTVKKLQEKRPGSAHYLVARFPLSVISRELMKRSRRHPGVTTVILMKRAVRRHPRHRFEVSRSKVLMPLIFSAVDDAFPSLPGAHPKKDTGAAQQTKVSD